MANTPVYFGKYRAEVTKVYDDKIIEERGKENRGRIKVKCPKVLGESESNWCEPCIPYCWDENGDYYLPEKGDTVWIEFEEGDANKPIWVGNWFKKDKTPIANTLSRDETADPYTAAKPLEDYKKHHDKTRIIQFGKFWVIIHREPDYMRVYIDDQAKTEFFTDLECAWLKRLSGTMTFYTNDTETYLERTAGDMKLYTNDAMTYLHRFDSELHMIDENTRLWKGANTITMTTEDTTFDVPNDITFNIGNNATWNIGNDNIVEIGNDNNVQIKNDNTLNVGNDMETTVTKNLTETVKEDISRTAKNASLSAEFEITETSEKGNITNTAEKGSVDDVEILSALAHMKG